MVLLEQQPESPSSVRASARNELLSPDVTRAYTWTRRPAKSPENKHWIHSVANGEEVIPSSPYSPRAFDRQFKVLAALEPTSAHTIEKKRKRLYEVAARAVATRERLLDDIDSQLDRIPELREATLRAVEAIVDWRKENDTFLWQGHNYLLSLASGEDVEQLLSIEAFRIALMNDLESQQLPRERNALLLHLSIDEIATAFDKESTPDFENEGENAHHFAKLLEMVRARRVARVLVAEERAVLAAELRDRRASQKQNKAQLQHMTLPTMSESEALRLAPPQLDLTELEDIALTPKPEGALVATLCCLHLVLFPHLISHKNAIPTLQQLQTRPLRTTLLKAPRRLLNRLTTFNPALPLSSDVLRLVWPVLTSDRFDIDQVRDISPALAQVFDWLRALAVFHSCQQPAPPTESKKKSTLKLNFEEEPTQNAKLPIANNHDQVLNSLYEEISTLKAELLALRPLLNSPSAHVDCDTLAAYGPQLLLREESERRIFALSAARSPLPQGLERPLSCVSECVLINGDLKACAVPALDVDRLTGATPAELNENTPADRIDILLRALDQSRPLLCTADHQVNGLSLRISVQLRLLPTSENTTITVATPNAFVPIRLGIRVCVQANKNAALCRTSSENTELEEKSLDLDDNALQLLLIHQPGLYERAHLRWKSLVALAEWILTRLSIDRRHSGYCLELDRSIPIAEHFSSANTQHEVRAEQNENKLLLHLNTNDVDNTIRIHIDELRAFAGASARRDLHDTQQQQGLLAALRQRVAVQDNFRLDRVIYEEVRRISGKSMAVQALVQGRDLIFKAKYISAGSEDAALKDELTTIVSENDMSILIASERLDHQRLLLLPYNRAALARLLTGKLKLVEDCCDGKVTFRLESTLVCEKYTLAIGIDGVRDIIGSLVIDDATTLEDIRRRIHLELDEEEIPSSFRFAYQKAPCGRRQEPYRLAVNCMPTLILLTSNRKKIEYEDYAPTKTIRISPKRKSACKDTEKEKSRNNGQSSPQTRSKKIRSRIFSKVQDALNGRRKSIELGIDNELIRKGEDAVPPLSEPLIMDEHFRGKLQTVAIPLGTTAMIKQGATRIEFKDDVALLDLLTCDVLRIGNRLGSDWTLRPNPNRVVDGCFRGVVHELTKPYDHDRASVKSKLIASSKLKESEQEIGAEEEDYIDPHTLLIKSSEDMSADGSHSSATEDGTVFEDVLVYRLIPKALDLRPRWRILFDNGQVSRDDEFTDSRRRVTNFRVPIKYSLLEPLVVDVSTFAERASHAQRVDFFERVSIDHLVDEIHRYLCAWYPQSDGVDGAKWAKFARDNELIPDVRNPVRAARVDIAFKRQFATIDADGNVSLASKKAGRLTRPMLREALIELAFIKYPDALYLASSTLEAEQLRIKTLRRLITECIILIPEINRRAWREAKILAMLIEARRQAAATRIATTRRKYCQLWNFRIILKAVIKMAAASRRFLYRKYYRLQIACMDAAYLFRLRTRAAFYMQAFWRRYAVRRDYQKRKKETNDAVQAQIDLRRHDQHERYLEIRDSTVLRRVKRINGWLVKTTIRRSNTSRAAVTTDFGLIIEVYIPVSQATFSFRMDDKDVRSSLELYLGLDSLSGNEILDPESLAHLANRLLVRVVNKRPIVILTRRGHSERGTQVQRRGLVISGEAYVVTSFSADDEVVFHAYSGKTCETLRTSVLRKFLEDWLMQEHANRQEAAALEQRRRVAEARALIRLSDSGVEVSEAQLVIAHNLLENDENDLEQESSDSPKSAKDQLMDDKNDDDTIDSVDNIQGSKKKYHGPLEILNPEHLQQLMNWLMSRLSVIWYTRLGTRERKRRLVLSCQLDEVKQERAAIAIQKMFKSRKSLLRIRRLIRMQWEKRFDAASGHYYYVRLALSPGDEEEIYWEKPKLLGSDDLDVAPDEWRIAYDEAGNHYYTNPATGQSSWLSVDEAAKAIQRIYRKKQAQDYGHPSFEQMVRALKMQNEVVEKYATNPERLSSMVNYALLLHTQCFDFTNARKLYKSAMEVSPENPVLLRVYGIFLLAAVEAPRQAVFDKAFGMFKNAELRDPGRSRFKLTEDTMFHWAVICQRDNPLALLNYALMLQCVVGDYERAERFYHRAISALGNFSKDKPLEFKHSEDKVVIIPLDKARKYVMENFETFEAECLPDGRYASKWPTGTVVRNCTLAEERVEWGEWSRMSHSNQRKPNAIFYLWVNKLTGRGCWNEPDWSYAIQNRIERSQFMGEKQGYSEYYDSRLSAMFWYNPKSQQVCGYDPSQAPPQALAGASAQYNALALSDGQGYEGDEYYDYSGHYDQNQMVPVSSDDNYYSASATDGYYY